MAAMTSPFDGRTFGILLHPSCLFGRDDIGTLGDEALRFVDWLSLTGAGIWQILPLTRNGQYDSPYFSYSTFAGNPWLVDLPHLSAHGLLPEPRLHAHAIDAAVPFADLPQTKRPQLLAAAETFLASPAHPWHEPFARFRAQEAWLADTAHFFALKEEHDDAPWWEWSAPVRRREPGAISESRAALADRIALWEALFFFADLQWARVRAFANSKGIKVLGDLPIYVNHDSADVWLHQEQFFLDQDGHLTVQSGVPPDYFSRDGQRWGNPLYRWGRLRRDKFRWWLNRLRSASEMFDWLRIDHFIGFANYYSIPAASPTAREGKWVRAPGTALFKRVARELPELAIVAEDLGEVGPRVKKLIARFGYPGMKVLSFGFDSDENNPHFPGNIVPNSVVYTGTHDNDTVAGWWEKAAEPVKAFARRSLPQIDDIVDAMIECAFRSIADAAIVPMQDFLHLGGDARMNYPGTVGGNWRWRVPPGAATDALADGIRLLNDRTGLTVSVMEVKR